MDFNETTYCTCLVLTSIASVIYYANEKLSVRLGTTSRTTNGGGKITSINNLDFVKFRRHFALPYLICLFADCLQQPYLYYLFQSYGYLQRQITFLYVTYYLSNVAFNFVAIYLLAKLDRKVLCCCFPALSSLSCFLKFSSNYNALVLSRFLDGACSALVFAPFHEWYANEHLMEFDFPKDWIPVTFRLITIISMYLAVGSGFLAEFLEDIFKITVFPFLLAVPLFVAAGTWICFKWHNSLPPDVDSLAPSFWHRAKSSWRLLQRSTPALLLGVMMCLVETCRTLTAFAWTPIFAHLTRIYRFRPAFGGAYSAFAAAALLGLTLSRLMAANKFGYGSALTVASGFSLIGSVLTVTSCYPDHQTSTSFDVTLYGLCLMHIGFGIYGSSIDRARQELIPFEARYYINAIFSTPFLLVCSLLLATFSWSEGLFNWLLMVVCLVAALLSLMTSFALQSTALRQQAAAVDHVVFEVKGGESYDVQ